MESLRTRSYPRVCVHLPAQISLFLSRAYLWALLCLTLKRRLIGEHFTRMNCAFIFCGNPETTDLVFHVAGSQILPRFFFFPTANTWWKCLERNPRILSVEEQRGLGLWEEGRSWRSTGFHNSLVMRDSGPQSQAELLPLHRSARL